MLNFILYYFTDVESPKTLMDLKMFEMNFKGCFSSEGFDLEILVFKNTYNRKI